MSNDSHHHEITKDIASGRYFKDAWQWYSTKYLFAATERSAFIVITVIALVVGMLSLYVFFAALPLTIKTPVFVEIASPVEHVKVVKPLSLEGNDAGRGVVRFMLERFVQAWEGYDESTFWAYQNRETDSRYLRVEQVAAPELMELYQRRMNPRNLQSPLIRFKTHTTRNVTVTSIQLPEVEEESTLLSQPGPHYAVVAFRTTEVSNLGRKRKNWVAEITFTMSPITFDKETQQFSELDFTVLSYSVTAVS